MRKNTLTKIVFLLAIYIYQDKNTRILFSCEFNSTLQDLIDGREKDGDVDPIWEGEGYCLCDKVIYIKYKIGA